MCQELLYTSAAQGLKLGSRGFCTVLRTSGMPAPLVSALESLSGYRPLFPPHDERAALNPIIYSHVLLPAAGRTVHVLSRISAYGLDYSQRPNKLAHHLVLDRDEQLPGGPANLLLTPGIMRVDWDGQPREIPARKIVHESSPHNGTCQAWQSLTGDAGWAGVLAETFLSQPNRLVILLFEPGQQILPLFAEAISLLPPEKRWEVTFSTYFTGLPPASTCLWRAMLHDSKEARDALRFTEALRLDLTCPLPLATGGPLVVAARTGVCKEHDAPETLIPQESELSSLLPSDDFEVEPQEITHTSWPPAIAPQPPQLTVSPVVHSTPPSRPQPVPADHVPSEPRHPDAHWSWYYGMGLASVILIALSLLATLTLRHPLGKVLDIPTATPVESVAVPAGPAKAGNAPQHNPIKPEGDPKQISKPLKIQENHVQQNLPVSAAKPADAPSSSQPETPNSKDKVSAAEASNQTAPSPDQTPMIPHTSAQAAVGSRSVTPEIHHVDFSFMENENPAHDGSRKIHIHSYDWPEQYPVPTARDIHEFVSNRKEKEQHFRQEFGKIPQVCELLTPRWIPWKAEPPKKNAFDPSELSKPSILHLQFGLDERHQVAAITVEKNNRRIDYYILRESQLNAPLLSWCAIHVTNPDDNNPPKQIILNKPYIPKKKEETRLDTRRETAQSPTWDTNYYLRKTDQPELILERLTLQAAQQSYSFADQPFTEKACRLSLTGLADWLQDQLKLEQLKNKLNLDQPDNTEHSKKPPSEPPPEMQIRWEWAECANKDDLGRLQLRCEIKGLTDKEGLFTRYDKQLNELRSKLEDRVRKLNLPQPTQPKNNHGNNNNIKYVLNTIEKIDKKIDKQNYNYENDRGRVEMIINDIVQSVASTNQQSEDIKIIIAFLQELPEKIKLLHEAYQRLKQIRMSVEEHLAISELVIAYNVYKISDTNHHNPVRLTLVKWLNQ